MWRRFVMVPAVLLAVVLFAVQADPVSALAGEQMATPPPPPPDFFEQYLPWLIVGIVVLILVITGMLLIANNRRREAQEKSSEVPISPGTLADSTSVSLGTLRCTEGEHAGKSFSLTEKGLIIGRDNECDIRLNSEIIARHQTWIGPRDGEITVKDMGSTNGTFVNGRKIEGAIPLQKGDVVSLSRTGQETFQVAD